MFSKTTTVFIVSFVVYMIFLTYQYYFFEELVGYKSGVVFFAGDESHYILAAENLVKNHSFYMENIYGIPNSGMLQPLGVQFHAYYFNGHFILTHGIGLPLLLAIPYFFGGIFLSQSIIVLLFAVLNVVIFKTCCKFVSENVSFVTALVFGFATLLFAYSNQVYPDIVMGLLIMSILYLALTCKPARINMFLIGILLSFGILLKVTFLIVPMIVLPILIIKLIRKKELRIFPYVLGGSVIFISFFFWYNFVSFGNPFTYPSYCYTCNADPILILTASLFGRYDGLITFSPIVILSFYGLYHAYLKNREFVITGSLIAVAWALGMSTNSLAGLGLELPSRYLTTLIPLATVPFACALEKYKKNLIFLGTTMLLVLIGFSLALGMTYNRWVGLTNANEGFKSQLLSYVYRGVEQTFPILYGKDFTYNWSNITSSNMVYLILITVIIIIPLVLPLYKKINSMTIGKNM